jgi:hypothetical protein
MVLSVAVNKLSIQLCQYSLRISPIIGINKISVRGVQEALGYFEGLRAPEECEADALLSKKRLLPHSSVSIENDGRASATVITSLVQSRSDCERNSGSVAREYEPFLHTFLVGYPKSHIVQSGG